MAKISRSPPTRQYFIPIHPNIELQIGRGRIRFMSERTKTRITVNGKTYGSVEEMPADVRREYEQAMRLLADQNRNGIPDVFEGGGGEGTRTVITDVTTTTQRFVNGREVGGDDPRVMMAMQRMSQTGPTVQIPLPTLLALLATVALIAAVIVWWVRG
jgi:hypothetical protein